MEEIIEIISRLGRLNSEYLKTGTGEADVLGEIDKLTKFLNDCGCTNTLFFDSMIRQGFIFTLKSRNKEGSVRDSYVYALYAEDSGLTKIGFSTRIDSRVGEISRMSGSRLKMIAKIPASKGLEAELHKRYDWLRAHGEWFSLREEHRREIASHPQNQIPSLK